MLPQLKAGSVVNLPIGSAFVGKIQECFQQHVTGHEAELKKLTEKKGNYDGEPLTAWENMAVMFSTLLQGIMNQAEKDGQIEYVSMEEVIKMSMPATPNGPEASSDQH